MSRKLHSIIAAATFLILARGSNAAIVTFNDRATFSAHTTSLTTIDFGGIAPSHSFVNFNTPQGLTLSGINFVGINAPTSLVLLVVDGQFPFIAYTGRGGQVASLESPVTGANSGIQVNLPGGINAVGMDLFTVITGSGQGTDTDTVRISIGAQTFQVPTVTTSVGNGRVFFGFDSDTPVSSFIISATGNQAVADVVNFTFGVAAPVPLPAAVWLFGSSLVGLLGWARPWTSCEL